MSTEIKVHPNTENPTYAWCKLKVKQHKKKVAPLPLDTPVYPDKVRFVCMSDTHCRPIDPEIYFIPPGDVFLHAGDFTSNGSSSEITKFNTFLETLNHSEKVVIAGNHERSLGRAHQNQTNKQSFNGTSNPVDLLTNCTYLCDTSTTVFGIKIYGSPWQPQFANWAFNLPRGQQLLDIWDKIPEDTEVLMTHGPPIGYGDRLMSGERVGCVELLSVIQHRVKPKFHIFGHIHESPGIWTDGRTTFINASTCNRQYQPVQDPVIFDIPLPKGVTK